MSETDRAERIERFTRHEHVQSRLSIIATDPVVMKLFEGEDAARIEALVEARDEESRRIAQADVKAWRVLLQMIRMAPKLEERARKRLEHEYNKEVT